MTTELYFNAFHAEVDVSRWRGLSVKQRVSRSDKFLRAEIARRWRAGEVLAEVSEGDSSWILHRDTEPAVLADHAYRVVPIDVVPAAVLLNFYLLLHAPAAGSRAVFVGTGYKLWEARRSRDGERRDCLAPRFRMWGQLVVVNVAATSVRTAPANVARALPVYGNVEGVIHRSVGYRVPKAGELVRDPPAKGAKTRIAWTPSLAEAGPLAAKATFLHWLVSQINADGFVRLTPRRFESTPLKAWIGARGQDAKLKKAKLIRAIELALPERNVALYDRRTDASERVGWLTIVRALRTVASRFGMTVTDRGTRLHNGSDAAVFVAIDAEALFADDETLDTKQAAVASFPGPVQCFSQSIVEDDSDSVESVAESVFLVMLANVLIKQEVVGKHLLLHREWVAQAATMDIEQYFFCERFVFGEEAIYVGLRVSASGALDFTESRALPKLINVAEERGLTPVFKCNPGDQSLQKWPGAIAVADTPIKALPLLSRQDMTSHFTGLRVVEELNAYYAAGAERPGPGKIEKAVVLRHVSRGSGLSPQDLAFVAGCCVDPTVRLHAATVWPAPFKLIREYTALYHGHDGVPRTGEDIGDT
ncbi:MAG: hypothetical protein ACN6OP_29305 [Pseudomonadales bacterium]